MSDLKKIKSKRVTKICETCGKEFEVASEKSLRRYCCEECQKKAPSYRAQQTHKYFLTHGVEGVDFVICPICGIRAVQLHDNHFISKHNMSREEVVKKFPNFKWTCDKFIEKNLKGENNPSHSSKVDYEERQKRSPFSLEFYLQRYDTLEEAQNAYNEFLKFHSENQKKIDSIMYLKHWIDLGYSEEEAHIKVREKCISNGIEYYIKKYGEEEGTVKYFNRIEKWEKSLHGKMPGSVYSNISFEIFSEIIKGRTDKQRFMFGSKEKIVKDEINKSFIFPVDFYDTKTNKIIEFNGDFWHANPEIYDENAIIPLVRKKFAKEIWMKDQNKLETLRNAGYEVLVIWEKEWKEDNNKTLEKCRNFLFCDEENSISKIKEYKVDELF